jgi:hypothetical protein
MLLLEVSMSLIKKHAKTEKKLAANRRNQRLCHGPVTDEGRECIRAALRRFGYNAPAEETAMRALGEDPAGFQELLEVLWEEWNPSGGMQEGVVISLARAMWLMNRAARMQEGCAVRQATEVNTGRADRLHAKIMRLKMTEDRLGRLAQAVAREYYVTPQDDLERMKNLHQEGDLKEMGEIALALFYQLQAPGTDEDGMDEMERARIVVRQVKDIFGIDTKHEDDPAIASPPLEEGRDARYPTISPAEWEARERPRQLLENILKRQVETCQAQRKAILKETREGPSPYERAAEIAPTHPHARLMRRMQDSNLKEVRRLTNLLLKIKRHERQMEGLEETAPFQDVSETKGVSNEGPKS